MSTARASHPKSTTWWPTFRKGCSSLWTHLWRSRMLASSLRNRFSSNPADEIFPLKWKRKIPPYLIICVKHGQRKERKKKSVLFFEKFYALEKYTLHFFLSLSSLFESILLYTVDDIKHSLSNLDALYSNSSHAVFFMFTKLIYFNGTWISRLDAPSEQVALPVCYFFFFLPLRKSSGQKKKNSLFLPLERFHSIAWMMHRERGECLWMSDNCCGVYESLVVVA